MVLFDLSHFTNIDNHCRSRELIFLSGHACHMTHSSFCQSLQEKHTWKKEGERRKWERKTQRPQLTASAFHTQGNRRPRRYRLQSGHSKMVKPPQNAIQIKLPSVALPLRDRHRRINSKDLGSRAQGTIFNIL